MTPEEKIIGVLRRRGVDFFAVLPCDRNKKLYDGILGEFNSVEINREEEGCGICAGVTMAGARPAMLIQNSGLGNMINALASLNRHYDFPLPILMSWRGMESETIAAQRWMGAYVPKIMDAMDIPYHEIRTPGQVDQLDDTLDGVYAAGEIRGYLFEPALWKGSDYQPPAPPSQPRYVLPEPFDAPMPAPAMTRHDMLKGIAPALEGKAVACNLGIPCKELYDVAHQPSNFYMLGSMGMVSPIALGMALCSDKRVVSIDGDGSVLMNPSTLATAARSGPSNLTVLCVDNGAYGSTGNQYTAASACVDLAKVARGFGFARVVRSAEPAEVAEALGAPAEGGPMFIHAICRAGNADVPNITLEPAQIRRGVSDFLQA